MDIHDPYRIPRPAVISFEGGRTSGYMLAHIVAAHGGTLPDDIAVVFANTGLEHPATLDFVDTCARAWGVRVVWVEYDWDAPHRTRIVDHRSASRGGEPYAALIDRKGFVPNIAIRFCTGFLYVELDITRKRPATVGSVTAAEGRAGSGSLPARCGRSARPPCVAPGRRGSLRGGRGRSARISPAPKSDRSWVPDGCIRSAAGAGISRPPTALGAGAAAGDDRPLLP